MSKTVVKPWVKTTGIILAVAAIVFGLWYTGKTTGLIEESKSNSW